MPNNDLISLSELLKYPIRADHYDKENGNEHFIYGIESVLEYAQNLPRVDAEPVRREKWIFYSKASIGGHNVWMCSECDTSYNYVECMNYCPNCGAKMDKEE